MTAADRPPSLDDLRRLPGEALLPVAFVLAVVDAESMDRAPAVPPADLTVAQLAQRQRLSPSRVRELIAAGEWGSVGEAGGPWVDGRRLRVPVAAVLARDARLRGEGSGARVPEQERPTSVGPAPLRGSLRDRTRERLRRRA